ncbi:MAG: hypothetical protein HDQ44_03195, partial [Desulfovibrio sp.]|nr:hypothetical protein [Desulfovibrio sp.]
FLSGCVLPGQSSYLNDPLTGGVDSRASLLLNIPLPSGLQYYPSHSSKKGGGRQEGLEVLRGHVDQGQAATSFYSHLKLAGWQLRMREDAGNRAIYIYEKGDELCAILFQAQGMLTIVQIWKGARLADNAQLGPAPQTGEDSWVELPGETYGPDTGQNGAEERFGPAEREL